MSGLHVVLDTNCLVSALIFSRGRMSWLRQAWQTGKIVPFVCQDTVKKLLRVFAYPKFKLDKDDIENLLGDFLPWVQTVILEFPLKEIPALRDRDDAVFIHLAQQTGAAYLVSGGQHLLELQDVFSGLHIVSPSEFQKEIARIRVQ